MSVFEGTVIRLAQPTPAGGVLAVYRPAKCRVERVCKGKIEGREIVVDHYIITGKELDGVGVGDRISVAVYEADGVRTRWDVEGIRGTSDAVKMFYVGGGVAPVKPSPCRAGRDTLINLSLQRLENKSPDDN
jgi:hypothetical protein